MEEENAQTENYLSFQVALQELGYKTNPIQFKGFLSEKTVVPPCVAAVDSYFMRIYERGNDISRNDIPDLIIPDNPRVKMSVLERGANTNECTALDVIKTNNLGVGTHIVTFGFRVE